MPLTKSSQTNAMCRFKNRSVVVMEISANVVGDY